jgi:hypothetical protein
VILKEQAVSLAALDLTSVQRRRGETECLSGNFPNNICLAPRYGFESRFTAGIGRERSTGSTLAETQKLRSGHHQGITTAFRKALSAFLPYQLNPNALT